MDSGLNAEIRYEIMSRESDETHKFSIDPVSGHVRAVVSFAKDAGKVFGFDVKATDRRGAEDGRYSIANVFVSMETRKHGMLNGFTKKYGILKKNK